jgi:hypothetical protein
LSEAKSKPLLGGYAALMLNFVLRFWMPRFRANPRPSAVSHPALIFLALAPFEQFPNRFACQMKSFRSPVPPATFQVGNIRCRDIHGIRQLPLGDSMLAPDAANQFSGPLMADLRDALGWQLQSHVKK